MQSHINVWKLPNASQIMNNLRNEGAIIFEEGSAGSVSKDLTESKGIFAAMDKTLRPNLSLVLYGSQYSCAQREKTTLNLALLQSNDFYFFRSNQNADIGWWAVKDNKVPRV